MTSGCRFLPYGRHTIEDDDIAAVAAALRDDFLTGGPRVEEFERAFRDATGANQAIACSSGTAALHLAVVAADLRLGDVAIVPALTFLATANVVRMTGGEVIFSDVDPETGLMTPASLEAALERASAMGVQPKVALPVHLNGQLCDMVGLARVAEQYNIALIEDACHALGVNAVGATAHSRMACFSTHPVKAIATGEGGVVTTADRTLSARLRQLRNHGIIREARMFESPGLAFDGALPNSWYYEIQEIGYNYRIPDLLCALGVSQLKKLDRFWRRRVELARLYDRLLTTLAPALRPVPHGANPHGWHLYAILIDFAGLGITRARVMNALRVEGIGTQVHYIPVHRQPYYRHRYPELSLPGAEAYYARCLSLPLYPAMADDDVYRVVAAMKRSIESPAQGLAGALAV
jgi:UDP-4-amino-4,6-dideoxy-N-acetyl-beta-L-altrosamine transaminase